MGEDYANKLHLVYEHANSAFLDRLSDIHLFSIYVLFICDKAVPRRTDDT